MKLLYILLSLLLIGVIIIIIMKYTAKGEGFATSGKRTGYLNMVTPKFSNLLNKAFITNAGSQNYINQVDGAFKSIDIFANNAKSDYSKFFIVEPFADKQESGKRCSSVLEPRFLPKHAPGDFEGCGWWYSDSDLYQSVGAYGMTKMPYYQEKLEKSVPGGEWIWDLALAQKKEDLKRCRQVRTCDMVDLHPGNCGFCVERNGGLPIDAGQNKYPDDPLLMCENIITKSDKCPKPPGVTQGLCDPDPVTGQLSKTCLVNLAKGVGLTSSGVILNILSGDSGGYYSGKGTNSRIFLSAIEVLKNDASVTTLEAYFGFGSCSRAEALGYYSTVFKIMSNGTTAKSRKAAEFLAVDSNAFDLCPEETDVIGPFDISCLEQAALESGCQPDGTDFPKTIKPKKNKKVPSECKNYGIPSADGTLRKYTKEECDKMDGMYYGNGECYKKTGGSYPWMCRNLNLPPRPPADVPAECKEYGRPNSDRTLRIYTKDECELLGGSYSANGECGSYSWNCRNLNSQEDSRSTKEIYDGMKWGDVLKYFRELYSRMFTNDKETVLTATSKCLGINIV